MLRSIYLFASLTVASRSSIRYDSDPYSEYHARIAKRAANSTTNFYEVDLGYAKYEGYYDEDLEANQWLGRSDQDDQKWGSIRMLIEIVRHEICAASDRRTTMATT